MTILGYFRCISRFFEGIFFYKTSPLTHAAVTESGGAMIVIILIYYKISKELLLIKI